MDLLEWRLRWCELQAVSPVWTHSGPSQAFARSCLCREGELLCPFWSVDESCFWYQCSMIMMNFSNDGRAPTNAQ